MSLTVYKASAGSGKTFSLTVEYIRLLVMDPSAYSRILAVTFTNKATGEMKERILQQLWGITHGDPASRPYLDVLLKKLRDHGIPMEKKDAIRRASEALKGILHHYGEMRIMTIDSFMQSLVRGLGRELGLGSRTEIELEEKLVVGEAVDNMIENLQSGPVLRDVTDFIISQIEDGKGWNVKSSLKEFCQCLLKEDYQVRSGALIQELEADPELIRKMRAEVTAIKKDIQNKYLSMAEDFEQDVRNQGLELESFNGKSKGALVSFIRNLKSGDAKNMKVPAKLPDFLEDAENWAPSSGKKKDREILVTAAREGLMDKLIDIYGCFSSTFPRLVTAVLILENIHDFGLLSAVAQQMSEDNRSKGRLLLAETNHLLNSMISGQDDAPFVLEKSGGSLSHIMIDEFQDTSLLQWNVLVPLCKEVLSRGGDCLIVGDVKQSIYRWRNSDWNILNDMSAQTLGYEMTEQLLKVNRRSKEHIVRLNNALFPEMVGILAESYQRIFQGEFDALRKAFHDVVQECPGQKGLGQVTIKEVPLKKDLPEKDEEPMLFEVCQEIRRMMDAGIQPRDITILMRFKTHMPLLAQKIEETLGVKALSEDAFLLKNSVSVNAVMLSLEVLLHPKDTIRKAALVALWQDGVRGMGIAEDTFLKNLDSGQPEVLRERERLLSLDIEELIETLISSMDLFSIKGEVPYIAALLEGAETFRQKEGGTLEDFIRFFNEKLNEQPISEAQESDGIRLMTIHKSKGLEFKNVIIPWAEWKTMPDSKYKNILWCDSDEEPFNKLSIIPVNYSDMMTKSYFKDTFEEEWTKHLVDNLNLLYVAMTRAIDNMTLLFYRFDTAKESKPEEIYKQVNYLISGALGSVDLEGLTFQTEAVDEEEKIKTRIWTLGGALYVSNEQDRTQKEVLNPLLLPTRPLEADIVSRPMDLSFRASNHSKEFVRHILGEDEDRAIGPMQRGTILHDMLSRLDSLERLDEEVERFVSEHQTGKEMEEEIRRMVRKVLMHPQAGTWFQSGLEVLKEREILVNDGGQMKVYRPDRVIRTKDGILVIDFKFAQKRNEHISQVRTYMELIRQMELTNASVSGILYYVDLDEIVNVDI